MRRRTLVLLVVVVVLVAGAVAGGLALRGDDGSGGVAGPVPGGEATQRPLGAPEGLAFDREGNLFVSEFEGNRVVQVTTDGALLAVAGDGTAGFRGDGTGANSAELNAPAGLFVTDDGRLYIADHHNDRIRVVGTDGFIATVPGSVQAKLSDPIGIAVDDEMSIYIADEQNARVVKLEVDGTLRPVAGGAAATADPGDGGPATRARLAHPSYVVLDGEGGVIFSDFNANRVRRVDANGVISTVAGTGLAGYAGDDGPAVKAQLDFPTGLALDRHGNLYVSDADNNRIRRIDRDGTITTVAGTGTSGFSGDGGPATEAKLNAPAGLAFDGAGNLYVADQGNDRVRRIDRDGVIATVAGRG